MTTEELINHLSTLPSASNVYFYLDGMYMTIDEVAWHTKEDVQHLDDDNSDVAFGTAQGIVVLI